jgi:hypothetical protein
LFDWNPRASFQSVNTLTEIEEAAEALPPEQKEELLRFLVMLVRSTEKPFGNARLVNGPHGTLLLEAPPGGPPMTSELVKQMLADFP